MSDKVYVSADLRTVSGKEDLLREALRQLVAAVRLEPGCILYDLHEDTDNAGHFMFYEIWEDKHAVDVHNNTDVMKAHVEKAGGWVESINVGTFRRI